MRSKEKRSTSLGTKMQKIVFFRSLSLCQ